MSKVPNTLLGYWSVGSGRCSDPPVRYTLSGMKTFGKEKHQNLPDLQELRVLPIRVVILPVPTSGRARRVFHVVIGTES